MPGPRGVRAAWTTEPKVLIDDSDRCFGRLLDDPASPATGEMKTNSDTAEDPGHGLLDRDPGHSLLQRFQAAGPPSEVSSSDAGSLALLSQTNSYPDPFASYGSESGRSTTGSVSSLQGCGRMYGGAAPFSPGRASSDAGSEDSRLSAWSLKTKDAIKHASPYDCAIARMFGTSPPKSLRGSSCSSVDSRASSDSRRSAKSYRSARSVRSVRSRVSLLGPIPEDVEKEVTPASSLSRENGSVFEPPASLNASLLANHSDHSSLQLLPEDQPLLGMIPACGDDNMSDSSSSKSDTPPQNDHSSPIDAVVMFCRGEILPAVWRNRRSPVTRLPPTCGIYSDGFCHELDAAIRDDDAGRVCMAILNGANPNQTCGPVRISAVHRASELGNVNALNALLLPLAGGDVNVLSLFGNNPLDSAAVRGKAKVVKALVEAKCDPNRETALPEWLSFFGLTIVGNYPIHFASGFFQHLPTVKALLDAGANPRLKNRNNETAFDVVSNATPEGRAITRLLAAWARDNPAPTDIEEISD